MPVGLRTMLGNIACAIKLRKSITVYIRVGSMNMYFLPVYMYIKLRDVICKIITFKVVRVIIVLGERGDPVKSTATLPLRCTERDIIL